MKRRFEPGLFRARSLRLPDRDYARSGAYFLTIRAYPEGPSFHHQTVHAILCQTWHKLPQRFPNVRLDAFVIMPDHIHGILWLDGTRTHKLGQIVGAYKSIATVSWIHALKSTGEDMHYCSRLWQDNYFEHLIRPGELNTKRRYIQNNPARADLVPYPCNQEE
jgi:putative transposase